MRPHGIGGRVLLGLDASVSGVVVAGLELFIGNAEASTSHEVISAEVHSHALLVKLSGLNDRDAAELAAGKEIFVRRDALPQTGPDEYYDFDVVGASVTTVGGRDLGRIIDIIVTGANDVYVAEGPEGEILIPAISAAIIEIDRNQGRIVIDPEAVEFSAVKEKR